MARKSLYSYFQPVNDLPRLSRPLSESVSSKAYCSLHYRTGRNYLLNSKKATINRYSKELEVPIIIGWLQYKLFQLLKFYSGAQYILELI